MEQCQSACVMGNNRAKVSVCETERGGMPDVKPSAFSLLSKPTVSPVQFFRVKALGMVKVLITREGLWYYYKKITDEKIENYSLLILFVFLVFCDLIYLFVYSNE